MSINDGYVERADVGSANAEVFANPSDALHFFAKSSAVLPTEFPIEKTVCVTLRDFCAMVTETEMHIISVEDQTALAIILKYPQQFGIKPAKLVGVPGDVTTDVEFDNATWGLPAVAFEALRTVIDEHKVGTRAAEAVDKRENARKPRYNETARDQRGRVDTSDVPEFDDGAGA